MTALCRDNPDLWSQSRDAIEARLRDWLMNYVDGDFQSSSQTTKLLMPLVGAAIAIDPIDINLTECSGILTVQPQFPLRVARTPMTLVLRLRMGIESATGALG